MMVLWIIGAALVAGVVGAWIELHRDLLREWWWALCDRGQQLLAWEENLWRPGVLEDHFATLVRKVCRR